jgi:hypothetical protein
VAPGFANTGVANAIVGASAGVLTDQKSFSITVTDGGVIFSNFGPGKAFDADPFHGWTINGFLGPDVGQQAIANQFMPSVTETFGSAEIALTLFSGPGDVVVFLQADSNGLPGPVLEQINVTGVTFVPTVFKATSVLHPQLQGGTPYWLTVVAGGAGVLAGWNWNSTGDTSTGANFAGTQGGSSAGPWGLDPNVGVTRGAFQINGGVLPIMAAFDLEPHTVNIESHGFNVTGYIELPNGFDSSDIDIATVRLAGSVPTGSRSAIIGDHNRNGVPDLMLKFRRAALDPLLTLGVNSLEVTGSLVTGENFAGTDEVRVIDNGGGHQAASVAPNPLNPSGVLAFNTEKPGRVRVTMFDLHGRLVRTLMEMPLLPAGEHAVRIDGRGERGELLPSGVYFYSVNSPDGTVTGRFAILK